MKKNMIFCLLMAFAPALFAAEPAVATNGAKTSGQTGSLTTANSVSIGVASVAAVAAVNDASNDADDNASSGTTGTTGSTGSN